MKGGWKIIRRGLISNALCLTFLVGGCGAKATSQPIQTAPPPPPPYVALVPNPVKSKTPFLDHKIKVERKERKKAIERAERHLGYQQDQH
jgi:hypothetical protein